MKIAITGASGFIGTHLREKFKDHVVIQRDDSISSIVEKLRGVDVVINLAGAPIIRRWTPSYMQVLRTSRIETTRKLVAAIEKSGVRQFISASAIGIYPDDMECDESCETVGRDFLASLCLEWEREALVCSRPVTVMRLGVILGRDGGALAKMIKPFRLCLGGPIGDGSMVTSWLHINDLVRIYEFVIERRISGTINAVAPNPVSNYELSRELSRIFRCPFMLPVPVLALKILYGKASVVLTGSKCVYPRRLLEHGFVFKFPRLPEALLDLLKAPPRH